MSLDHSARARADQHDSPAVPGGPPLGVVPSLAAESDAWGLPGTPRALRFLNGPLAGILMANAITFAGVMFRHWPMESVLLVYLGQNVAIGIANVIRILGLRSFSVDGLRMSGRPLGETPESKRRVAVFFAFHYGMFHLVYALILFKGRHEGVAGWVAVSVALNVALFAGSHVWPAVRERGREFRSKPNLGTLMFYPYLRLLPMHLAIILGSAFPQGVLPVFIALKTLADVGMHEVERRMFWRPAE